MTAAPGLLPRRPARRRPARRRARLEPAAEVGYERATLADPGTGARVTIDFGVPGHPRRPAVRARPRTASSLRPRAAARPAPPTGCWPARRPPRSFSKYAASASLIDPRIPDNDVRHLSAASCTAHAPSAPRPTLAPPRPVDRRSSAMTDPAATGASPVVGSSSRRPGRRCAGLLGPTDRGRRVAGTPTPRPRTASRPTRHRRCSPTPVAGTAADVRPQKQAAADGPRLGRGPRHHAPTTRRSSPGWRRPFPAPPATWPLGDAGRGQAQQATHRGTASRRPPGWRPTARRTSGSSTSTTRRSCSTPRPARPARPRRRQCSRCPSSRRRPRHPLSAPRRRTSGCRRCAPTTPSPRARSAPAPTPPGTPPQPPPRETVLGALMPERDAAVPRHGGPGRLLAGLHGRPLPRRHPRRRPARAT